MPPLTDEMVVIADQAVRHDDPIEPVHGLGEQLQKALSVSVVEKDRIRPIAMRGDVIRRLPETGCAALVPRDSLYANLACSRVPIEGLLRIRAGGV